MMRSRFCVSASLLLALAISPTARAATPEEVAKAIDDAKAFLYSTQNADGNWDDGTSVAKNGHYGGWTAIATYALLAAGESPQDERLQRAIQFLKVTDIQSIYSLGLRAQVWTFLPQTDETKKYVLHDAELLLKSAQPGTGRYGYNVGHGGEHNSPSQYGVLGVWACAQLGIDVPTNYWKEVESGWKLCQGADGGWQYSSTPPNPGKASPAFTAAGVATLFITQDYLHASEGVKCNGNLESPNIDAGLRWMGRNFASIGGNGYALYGVERIGVASGYKYFGSTDWYATGAETLVRSQAAGAWSTYGPTPGTAWGILFLCRGRAPVMMNKLQYDIAPAGGRVISHDKDKDKEKEKKEGNWNQRPRDCANVVRWVAKQSERDLNWQIVNLSVPVEELHDSPILYLAGNLPLSFTEDEEKKLKLYVEQGGIILANADCGAAPFANSVKKLGDKLFPAYKFVTLPAKHVINTAQRFPLHKMKQKPEVTSMSNGAREFIILLNGDPAKSWQMQSSKEQESMFQLADNIYEYAVDKKNARYKGDTYIVTRDEKIKADRTLKVARLQFDGNWDPEPGGWRRLANIMHNQQKMDVTVEAVKLGAGKLATGGYRLAHLTGTEKLKFNEGQQKEIKSFVDAGGILVVDSAGGDADFSQTAEDELSNNIFSGSGKNLQSPLKFDDPIFNIPQSIIKDVAYRSYARRTVGNTKVPQLRGIEIAGHTGVFFSREDLSVGLVGQAVDGILGYEPRSATAIMTNILLYAAGGGKAPTTVPAPAAATKPTTKPLATNAPATGPATAPADEK